MALIDTWAINAGPPHGPEHDCRLCARTRSEIGHRPLAPKESPMSSPVRALPHRPESLTMEDVLARIDRYVARGDYPYIAAELVTKELCREGRQDELLTLFWPPRLFEVWESSKTRKLTDEQKQTISERETGRRRVNCEVLRRQSSLLESLVQFNGDWLRLGDLDREMCRALAREQKKAALKHAHRARFFHAIAESLDAGARVREALDEATLERLYSEATP